QFHVTDSQGGSQDFTTAVWDCLGNFSVKLPVSTPGICNVTAHAVDRAGNQSAPANLTFTLQGLNTTTWTAAGPGPIDVTGAGVDYRTVSGNVTSTAVDPRDPSGNTVFVGTANGGVWKTTDGGNDWSPLTDYVRDGQGRRVPLSVGGLALAPSNPDVLYAGTS